MSITTVRPPPSTIRTIILTLRKISTGRQLPLLPLAVLVPFVLIKLNVDQAAGSAPIITSIKDIAGLLIYFAFVRIFLGLG